MTAEQAINQLRELPPDQPVCFVYDESGDDVCTRRVVVEVVAIAQADDYYQSVRGKRLKGPHVLLEG